MTKLQVSSAYISAATNRFNHAATLLPDSTTIAFATGSLIALWNIDDANDNGVYETLPGHEGTVTCLRFFRNDSFFSADDKGAVRAWRRVEGRWTYTVDVKAHNKPISALAVCDNLVATGSSDSSVKIWNIRHGVEKDELEECQTISLSGRYPLAIVMTTLPQSKAIILAIGGTDRNVNIWTRSENLFVRSATLPGHEDWVRALAFRSPPSSDGTANDDPLVLASGSQDGTIRLWNIELVVKPMSSTDGHCVNGGSSTDELLDAFEASLADPTEGEEGGRQITLKRHIISVKFQDTGVLQYTITFDALLIGHEAGVTSLSWASQQINTGNYLAPPTLLSTSTDSSLILWSPSDTVITPSANVSAAPSIWINRQRFGDVGGQRLGGFVGGIWAHTSQGDEAMAWGWSGGWRRWRSVGADTGIEDEWREVGAIAGHRGPVKDLAWSPAGEYLISVGLDQTTRIHGAISGPSRKVWHELARPQVHGYDLVGVVWLGLWTFASVADEKVVRVFEAPGSFIETVGSLGVGGVAENDQDRPVAASVPPLGLSNKATSDGTSPYTGQGRRPFDGELAATTLWPEVEKVFGHGYESITIASSHSHELIATACRATSPQHAVVRVYSASTYQPFGLPLEGHTLTVTRIAFSPDDRYIITVSRDRTWRAFAKEENAGYVPVAMDKSHARIIWDCAWSSEGDIFATASRDKTVKIWTPNTTSDRWPALATLKFREAATAVAFCSVDDVKVLLAVGLETGEIFIYSGSRSGPDTWELAFVIGRGTAHVDHIHRLAWRTTEHAQIKQLASCSEDGTMKIMIVRVGVD
ncbi:WD40-repeat-containing domain protein [Pisolithus marmoratus]|nr:WD40-repeat-containing domain protein [Pisolithus marmoratus]